MKLYIQGSNMNSRFIRLIFPTACAVFLAAGWYVSSGVKTVNNVDKIYEVQMSDDEWKEKLTDEQYHVMRKEGTERPFTSDLNKEKRQGSYLCAACGQELFSSSHKYDSGSGWPSFYQPIEQNAVGESTDYKLVMPRTEVHCARCGGHLGHVFPDGPEPTGLRYCMNGVALEFVPEGDAGKAETEK